MAERLKIPYPVVVEGRYDKLRLQNVIEAQILTTDGFGVFNKREKAQLFRRLAERTPVIVLTDTNADPDSVDFPIPGNDDAVRSIRLILSVLTEAINKNKA